MRRHRRHIPGEVELNLAAMLDMAFQLLAFFILTFRPTPAEGDLAMRMPEAAPITRPDEPEAPTDQTDSVEPMAGLDSLIVTALAKPDGSLASVRIAQGEPTADLQQFQHDLQNILSDPSLVFQQVVVEVDPNLLYEPLIRVLDACAKQKLGDGSPLNKLSFVELGAGSAAPPEEAAP